MAFRADAQPHARAATSVEGEAVDPRTGQQGEVRPFECRQQIAVHDAEAPSVLGIEIDIACAFAHRCTDIVEHLVAYFLAGPEEARRQGTGLCHRFDMQGAVRTTMAVAVLARAGLDAAKHRLKTLVVPAAVAGVGPLIEVGWLAPDPDHGVDAAGSADDLAAWPVDGASRGSRLRRRAIGPVDIGSEGGRPEHRALQRRAADVVATRFDQQHLAGRVFGKARSKGAAGGAGPDDDIVMSALQRLATRLIAGSRRPPLRRGDSSGADARRGRQANEAPSIDLARCGPLPKIGEEAPLLVIGLAGHADHPFGKAGPEMVSPRHGR